MQPPITDKSKFWQIAPVAALIFKYVEDNEIERPMDFMVRQIVNKSKIRIASPPR